jgi:hypothetical protein
MDIAGGDNQPATNVGGADNSSKNTFKDQFKTSKNASSAAESKA